MKDIKCFRGVYAADELMQHVKFIIDDSGSGALQTAVIINTDPSWLKGAHWVALYFIKKSNDKLFIEFFDSYGNDSPESFIETQYFNDFVTEIRNRLNIKKIKMNVNIQRLQGAKSDVCGCYCCVYIYLRCCYYNLSDYLSIFFSRKKYTYNDCKIRQLFNNIFANISRINCKSHILRINQKCSTLCCTRKQCN